MKIKDLKDLPPKYYVETLEVLKLTAIDLENDIEKTERIESPTEARQHVQDLERKLIKVMPQMNLMSDLVKFRRLYEGYQQSAHQETESKLVALQEDNIKVGID